MENKKMKIGMPCSTASPQRQSKRNFNEFFPINSKATGNEIIKEFLYQKDVAAWFRGTSHYHIKGANRLFNALRDDGEQETTHRVRTCLNLIGLKPMLTSKQIKFLMQLSRGNDLVFLWFLMEKHYKTPKIEPCTFSQNEQLICSAICHLDMVTTLRELDKILPRGQTALKCIEVNKKCVERQDLKEAAAKENHKMSALQLGLPYFTKHNQPQHYGKSLFLEQPNFRVNFKYYSHFNNPNYIAQNEANRWYANYHFNPGKRIVHSIIFEIIKSIFYSFALVSLKTKSSEILCGHHKALKITKTNLKHQLRVKARDDCLKRCWPAKQKEAKVKQASNIKNGLDDAVQQQMCLFSKQSETASENYTLKTITGDCKIYDIILGGAGGDCSHTANCESLLKRKASPGIESYTPNTFEKTKQQKDKRRMADSVKSPAAVRDSLESNQERFNEQNSCAVNQTISASSEVFFKRPFMHQPYKFDYRKIFANCTLSEESSGIRKILMKVLNENTSNLSTAEKKDSQPHVYDEVVENFIQTAFKKEIKRYEAEHKKESATHHAESSNPLTKYPSPAYYNTENFHLMDQMLFEAFQHLRKNPKFVWAQLPDAHKVPFLREWIVHRFGKMYTPRERLNSYRRSCIVFRALESANMKSSAPNANKMGKNFFVDYNCRQHVERKAQQLKRKYYHSLDAHLLEHTRVFWFAMRGYICSNGPPRKSFYAYMPSRLQDIQHICLWKSNEYRNNWAAWNIRRNKRV